MMFLDTPWEQPPFSAVGERPAEPPVGTVVPYAGRLDAGALQIGSWCYCDGSALSKSVYPELYLAIGETYGLAPNEDDFLLPDYRGLFHRGLDTADPPGTPRDPGISGRKSAAGEQDAGVGSLQEDQFEEHEHQYTPNPDLDVPLSPEGSPIAEIAMATEATTTAVVCASDTSEDSEQCFGPETRPKNIYVYYLIKARSSWRFLQIPAWPSRATPW